VLKNFVNDHIEIIKILDRMPRLLDDNDPTNEDAIRNCRWELSRVLFQHIAREERELYSLLDSVEDKAMRDLAERFRADLEELHGAFKAHMHKWATHSISGDRDRYRADVVAISDRLRDRFHREEAMLFPAVRPEHLKGTGAVRKNWVRDVWSFRDQILR
jgi:Hemerythrin HHE cation binding domain